MSIDIEQLGALADGELSRADRELLAATLSEPDRAQLAAFEGLNQRIKAHYDPILDEEVPARFAQLLLYRGEVIDFAAAKKRHDAKSEPKPIGRRLPIVHNKLVWVGVVAACLAAAALSGPIKVHLPDFKPLVAKHN